MSFRSKLSISFALILLLTVTVTLISWWCMERALDNQEDFYQFKNDIENTLLELNLPQPSAHAAINDSDHSREVYTHISEIRQQLALLARQTKGRVRGQQFDIVLRALDNYQKAFGSYRKQYLDLQNIQEKMLGESTHLLDRVENAMGEPWAAQLHPLITTALIAQRDYFLSGLPEKAREVQEDLTIIREKWAEIKKNAITRGQGAKAFGVTQAVLSFLDWFKRYADQKIVVMNGHQNLNSTFLALSNDLSRAVNLETEVINRRIDLLRWIVIGTGLLALVMAGLATAVLAERITRPINLLRRSTQKIVNGDLNTTVAITSRDEIGDLCRIFNQMTIRLKENFRELEAYQDHLEERVKERTHELELEISDRLEAEKELASSENRFRAFFDNAGDGILIVDPSNRELLSANRRICSMLGYSVDELLNLSLDQLHPRSDIPAVLELFEEMTTNTMERTTKELPMLRRDGSTFFSEVTVAPIEIGGQPYLMGIFRDVTERRAMEEERLKIRKLESVGLLAGGIAHDFNNILAAILGNISLSLALTKEDDKRHPLLRQVEKASLRARDLTQQLLTFSKGGEPVKELTSVAEIIRESANFVLRGSSVRCDYTIPDDLWAAEVDAGQISQVIQNIVTNSRHAMPNGGVININCRNITPTMKQAGPNLANRNCIEIRIIDHGIGIPPELHARVFDPYFSTKKQGSGLGLAITHSIITKHGGQICLDSVPGEGTTFIIVLPAIARRLPIQTGSPPRRSRRASGNILVMDDEQQVRTMAAQMLTHLGYTVTTVEDGKVALEEYRKSLDERQPFDAVIMDLTIPGGMGGKETAQKILEIDKAARLIVSSGYSQDPIMAQYRQFGFKGHLNKPYQLQDLQLTLEEALATA